VRAAEHSGFDPVTGLEPGDLTRYMALPWQEDSGSRATRKESMVNGREIGATPGPSVQIGDSQSTRPYDVVDLDLGVQIGGAQPAMFSARDCAYSISPGASGFIVGSNRGLATTFTELA
jgi:hypothetical protein